MKKQKFYICRTCGNLVEMIHNSGAPMVCCGKPMEELKANTVEASNEKHLPIAEVKKGTVAVKVGSVEHPMLEEHYIEWIYLQTDQGCQRKELRPGQKPEATFFIGDQNPIAVFEYCNLHGLWKTEF